MLYPHLSAFPSQMPLQSFEAQSRPPPPSGFRLCQSALSWSGYFSLLDSVNGACPSNPVGQSGSLPVPIRRQSLPSNSMSGLHIKYHARGIHADEEVTAASNWPRMHAESGTILRTRSSPVSMRSAGSLRSQKSPTQARVIVAPGGTQADRTGSSMRPPLI